MYYVDNQTLLSEKTGRMVTKEHFRLCRERLGKTQKQVSQLLGTSVHAIYSYEQGWRNIPAHVERQMLFLISQKGDPGQNRANCWDLKNCPADRRKRCPAWEFRAGRICWFICGTICQGVAQTNWQAKMDICWNCSVLADMLSSGDNPN